MTGRTRARRDDSSAALTAGTALRRLSALAAIAIAAMLASVGPIEAQTGLKRVALVIGNAAYTNAPQLANPRNDANAMAASLRNLGFVVEEGIDLDTAGMYAAVRSFGALAETADVALVFYAGHGIQVDGTNYLLPTDVSLNRERDLNYEGVPLQLIMSEVAQTKRLGVVIIDACRDNPFAQQLARSMGPTRSALVGRGLARVEDAPADTLIAFATRDGAVAEDGDGVNSPYTTALLSHLNEPGLEIGQYFRRVRDTVMDATNGRQEPFVYGSLSADQFYLNPSAAGAIQQAAISVPPAPSSSPGSTPQEDRGVSNDTERLFWESIKDSDDKADFDAYLRQFPRGVFAGLARNRIAAIVAGEQAATPPAATTAPPRTDTAALVPPQPLLTLPERLEAQAALQRLGLYGGAIDGIFGPSTRAGVVAFQRSIGVSTDGNLTKGQLVQLRREAAEVPSLAIAANPSNQPVPSAPAASTPPPAVSTPSTQAADQSQQVAILPPPAALGNFGAIATSNSPNPVRRGICKNQPSQTEADACALERCGRGCEIRAQTRSGQCLAFVESREWGGGEGYGVGSNWNDAVEEAKVGCFRDAGRNYTCELIASACND